MGFFQIMLYGSLLSEISLRTSTPCSNLVMQFLCLLKCADSLYEDYGHSLTPKTQFNGKPLIVYFAQTVLRLLEICIMEHLYGFRVIFQEFTHNPS